MIIEKNEVIYNGYKGDEKLEKLLNPYMGYLDLFPIEELKPCPFCEAPAVIRIQELVTPDPEKQIRYYIRCTKCGLTTRPVYACDMTNYGMKPTPLTAMKGISLLWNNRVEDDTDNQGDRK